MVLIIGIIGLLLGFLLGLSVFKRMFFKINTTGYLLVNLIDPEAEMLTVQTDTSSIDEVVQSKYVILRVTSASTPK